MALNRDSSINVRLDRVTTAEQNELSAKIGEAVWNTDLEAVRYWNGLLWVGAVSQGDLESEVIVNQSNVETTLGGVIDSSKQYFIDGHIDLGATQITVPVGGISLRGLSFDVSSLYSTEDNYTMFISESELIGSGNLLGVDFAISVSGTNSKVYELYDATGFNAFEYIRVNYNNCTSLGDIHYYRQGLESGTGRFGGSPSLTLHGTWLGGYRITTSIVRSLDAGMTEPLFKTGTAFSMESRFLSDINLDLPSLASFLDFSNSNFPNPSTLQLQGCIVTRDGVLDSSDANITPNVDQKALCSDWRNNSGIPNTFIGGLKTVSSQAITTITAVNTPVIIAGTFTNSDLQHFDSNLNYSLRHLGVDPKDFRVTFDFVLEGTQGQQYSVNLMKDSGGNITEEFSQIRTIDRLTGGRDVAYFSGIKAVQMEQNDFLFWEVENIDSSQDCTLENNSQWFLEER